MNSSTGLAGKAVFISGGARRIGATLARTLHGAGANLVIHYRSSHSGLAAGKLCAELNEVRADSAVGVQADLGELDALPALVGYATEAFGRLDILINNASSFYPTPVGSITAQHWDDLLGSNLKAPLFLSQAAAPALRATGGLILNLVDIHALRPLKRHTVYCIAKAGLVMLTRSLARELGPEIRVNGIAPGPVLWPEGELDGELKEKIVAATALKRIGSPQDVAQAVLFFCKDAPFVTGQILAVDGGRSIGW